MKTIDQTIEQAKNHINDIPIKIFTKIDKSRDSGIVIYKYDEPLHAEDIKVKKSQNYSLMTMYSLSSLSVIFAYMFIFEKKIFDIKDKAFSIKRPSVKSYDTLSGVELAYQSPYINMYTSQEGATLVSANKLFKVIEQDMVRKSKGSTK